MTHPSFSMGAWHVTYFCCVLVIFFFLSCIVLTFPNKYTNSDQKAQQSMIIVNWPRKSHPFMDHTVTECIVVLRVETESIAVQSDSFQSNCEMTLMLLTWTSATASRCSEPIASFLALNKTVVHMMLSDVSCHLCSWYACCVVVRQSFGHHFNHLTPNGHYMGRTAQLTSRCCILYIYSTNIHTEYFKNAA